MCAGASFNLSSSQPNYWKGIAAFYKHAPAFVDAGLYVWYVNVPNVGLNVQPFVAPNLTVDEFSKVVQPFLADLTALNLTYKLDTPTTYPTFNDLYHALFSLTDDVGGGNTLLGGRLFSKDDITKNGGAITDAVRGIVEAGHVFGGHMVNPGRRVPDPDGSISAVHPVWRNNADSSLWVYDPPACLSEAGRQEAAQNLTHGLGDTLRKASPASAVYVNEVSSGGGSA